MQLLTRLQVSWMVGSAPLILYFLLGGTSLLTVLDALSGVQRMDLYWSPSAEEDSARKLSAELLKQKFQAIGYGITLLLLIGRVRVVVRFLLDERALLAVIVVLGATVLVSGSPARVMANLVHLAFGVLAAWVYFCAPSRQVRIVRSACLVVFIPSMLIQVGSLLMWLVHHDSSLSQLLLGQRYGGLSGNPNSLGGICVVGAWACFGLIRESNWRGRMVLIPFIAITLFNAYSTGSATTMLIIAAIAVAFVARAFYVRLGARGRIAIIMTGAVLFIGGGSVMVVQQSADDYAAAATEAVGKDLTLTGRTDLWKTAFLAFAERPVLGWGYDNHETVFATGVYEVPYVQYHNGYVDNLVNGGTLLILAIIWCFVSFTRRYRKLAFSGASVFPLLVIFGAVSTYNLTEYSLFRATSPVFQAWLVSYVAVACLVVRSRVGSASAGRRVRTRAQSNRVRASW